MTGVRGANVTFGGTELKGRFDGMRIENLGKSLNRHKDQDADDGKYNRSRLEGIRPLTRHFFIRLFGSL